MLVLMVLALGLFMAIAPKLSVKKEFRDDPARIKKTRISGIVLVVLAVLLEVVLYMTSM